MFLSLIFVAFLFAVIQGFVRVVVFFWEWLSSGDRLGEERVERAEIALDQSEDVLERELARAERKRGLGRLFARWHASGEAIDEYLDHLSLGWYQAVIIFFLGSMAGLLIEEVWMLVSAGLTESRVGLVWGPFSPLYGLGAVLLTWMSFHLRAHGAAGWQVFLVSAVVGGVLEQLAGWSMSAFFDAESWTYLHLPDHITQWVAWRFLAAWGVLGLVWCRAVMPRLLYQIGMPTTRRQAVFVTLVAVYLLFVAGVLICYFVIFPISFRFLGTYSVSGDVEANITLDSYVSTFLTLSLLMGVVFQLPVVAFVLGRLGLIDARMLSRYKKHAFIVILTVAAMITPGQDIFSLAIVTLPLYMLYMASILVVRKKQGQ